MQKALLIFIILLALCAVPPASAQSEIVLESVQAQVWPEYDRPAALVILDIRLVETTTWPAEVRLRIPIDAELSAVAWASGGELLLLEHQVSAIEGWQVVSFLVSEQTTYHLEYYAPIVKNGAQRDFRLEWAGDYAVKKMKISLQQPTGAIEVETSPELPQVGPSTDNFIYHEGEFSDLAANSPFVVQISYQKADNALSVSGVPVQSSGNLDEGIAGSVSIFTYLPWIVGGLGVALIFGGGFWFWQSGREGRISPGLARHRAQDAKGADRAQVYCSQCGKRAQPGDRFCRACGVKIQRGEI